MDRHFQALPIHELGRGAGFRRPSQPEPVRVTLDSPALEVMTDLLRSSPATIRPQAPVEGANQYMLSRGIRLLLVVDEHETVLGVVTATDILGGRAMRMATERGLKYRELIVADIMTAADEVEVLALDDVRGARVGHVIETLRRAGRQHALVVDYEVTPARGILEHPGRRPLVRGIFSTSQLARQLGLPPPGGGEVARTFSEIGAALSH